MFDFDSKDLERLTQAKTKNDIEDFPVCSRYLYIFENKMLFITKSRNDYRVCATGACCFEPYRRTQTFDILYFTKDLNMAIAIYKSYLMRLFWDSNELHSTSGNENKD